MRSSRTRIAGSLALLALTACADAPGRTTADAAAAHDSAPAAAPSTIEAQGGRVPGPTATTPAAPRRVMIGDLDLTGIGHDVGSATAPVVLVDFRDFGCPFCSQFTRETYPVIEREYVRTGRVLFKYVPFIVGMFPHAAEAARAAECAADQGRFWEMADRIYERQRDWKQSSDARSLLTGLAGAAGADRAKLEACYDSRRTDVRTRRATDIADALGVRVTPSFVLDGRPIEGALPIAEFRKAIDAALTAGRQPR